MVSGRVSMWYIVLAHYCPLQLAVIFYEQNIKGYALGHIERVAENGQEENSNPLPFFWQKVMVKNKKDIAF